MKRGSRESLHEAREEYILACIELDILYRKAGWPPPPRRPLLCR